jgi:group I intron endonuclease
VIVYKHTCIISGKCYIGLTVKPMMDRWLEHCSDANRHPRRKFFAAINKYGRENWTHEVLFESDDAELIVNKEMEFIELFDSVKNGYNMSKDRFRTGIKHTPESIERMRIAKREEHARRRAEGREGGWKRKDGGAMKGKVHPRKGQPNENCGPEKGKLGWKKINGTRVWFAKNGESSV